MFVVHVYFLVLMIIVFIIASGKVDVFSSNSSGDKLFKARDTTSDGTVAVISDSNMSNSFTQKKFKNLSPLDTFYREPSFKIESGIQGQYQQAVPPGFSHSSPNNNLLTGSKQLPTKPSFPSATVEQGRIFDFQYTGDSIGYPRNSEDSFFSHLTANCTPLESPALSEHTFFRDSIGTRSGSGKADSIGGAL